jgi:sulfide dehydrogenase cytochrome subunit
MKKVKLFKSTAFLAAGLLLMGSAHAEAVSGQDLAYSCAGCHGTNGVSTGPATPSIAGMSETYLIDTMMAYKDGRASTIMTRIAKGYTDAQIEAMSKFFAGLSFVAADQKNDSASAANGAKLHDKYCEKCHEDGGTSADDDSGFLKGQWKPYMVNTLEDFRDGHREMPKKMKKKVEQMRAANPDALRDLSEYYAGK